MKSIHDYISESILDNDFADAAGGVIDDAVKSYQEDGEIVNLMIERFMDWVHKEFKNYKIEPEEHIKDSIMVNREPVTGDYRRIILSEYRGNRPSYKAWRDKFHDLFKKQMEKIVKNIHGKLCTSVVYKKSTFIVAGIRNSYTYYGVSNTSKPKPLVPIIIVNYDYSDRSIVIRILEGNPNDTE